MNANELPPPGPDADDPRVIEALEEYLAAVESGERPNRQAFLARHAEVAEALADCLDGMDALHGSRLSASGDRLPADGREPTADGRQPLGDFRIVREVGRGGMGTV